jgi:23S rRNA (adenine2503-C2)-methyltransferase
VEQLVVTARRLQRAGQRLTNVVFMGMGEPLTNWPATWGTVETATDPDGLGLSPRRLTISTVGIVPGIRRLADQGSAVRLAVSLHAGDEELRRRLVPLDATYGLDEILAACRAYQAGGGRRITFEVVLIDGVNDSREQAGQLANRLGGLSAHVNLIPLNPVDGVELAPSPYRRAAAFQEVLQAAGISTTLRMRRGIEIEAGCGQLRTEVARSGGLTRLAGGTRPGPADGQRAPGRADSPPGRTE